ncbi:MAG: LysR family transcriptional regulator [Thiotrichaceae bacterium]
MLSRSLSQLEAKLGVRLLERSTRSLRPTEIGQTVYQDSRNTPCFSYGDISVLAFSFW